MYIILNSADGYICPKFLQGLSLPHLMAKKNCVLLGPSNLGKRMALLIACLQIIDPSLPHCQAILLTSCREEAFSLYDTITKLCSGLGINCRVLVGGRILRQDITMLQAEGVQLVFGTPGRIKDLILRRSLRTDYILYYGLIDFD